MATDVHPSATVYPGTVLGEGVRVLENAVVGKQPALGSKSTARPVQPRYDRVVREIKVP